MNRKPNGLHRSPPTDGVAIDQHVIDVAFRERDVQISIERRPEYSTTPDLIQNCGLCGQPIITTIRFECGAIRFMAVSHPRCDHCKSGKDR